MKRVINWFEIPACDLERAIRFYEEVFQTKLTRTEVNNIHAGVFPFEAPNPSGSIKVSDQPPGSSGPLIYLDGSPDIGAVLARVRSNGGTVVLDKTLICEDIGHIGIFIDSEGNRVGVHSPKLS